MKRVVRSFIYLDQYKLYSFSSQLFQGLVEHVVRTSERSRQHNEKQDEPDSPQRLVAEIAAEASTVSEKRYLHDHAYHLFEEQLTSLGLIKTVTPNSTADDFAQAGFVKVSGPATFADAPSLTRLLDSFNSMAEAIAYVSSQGAIAESRAKLLDARNGQNDRNKKSRISSELKKLTPKALSEAAGLRQDEEFLKRLAFLLKYGYQDQFLVQVSVQALQGSLLFSSPLDRSSLREPEDLLLRKYARRTDRDLVIVGVPTQSREPPPLEDQNSDTVRGAVANMVGALSGIEAQFAGRMPDEVLIDPVAVYLELSVG